MSTHRAAARAVVVVLICLSAEAVMHACPICFQIEDGHVINGVRAAVAVLMGVTGVVLVGFAVFATRFVRRTVEPPPSPRLRRTSRNPGTPEPRNP